MSKELSNRAQWALLIVSVLSLLAGAILISDSQKGGGRVVKWTLGPGGDYGYGPAVFASNGTMYVWEGSYRDDSTHLYCVSPDGEVNWTKDIYTIDQAIVGSDGTLYLGGWINATDAKRSVCALQPNGEYKWIREFRNGSFYSLSQGVDSNLYSISSTLSSEEAGGSRIASFTTSGDMRWYLSPGENLSFTSLFTAPNGTLMSCVNDHRLVGIGDNGSILWSRPAAIPVEPYIVKDDRMFGTLNYHSQQDKGYGDSSGLYCFDLNGTVLWKHPAGLVNQSFAKYVAEDSYGTLYYRGHGGSVMPSFACAVNQDGELLWQYVKGSIYSAVLYADELIVSTSEGIVALDISGNESWAMDGVSGSLSVSPSGLLIVTSWDGISAVVKRAASDIALVGAAGVAFIVFGIAVVGYVVTKTRRTKRVR